MNKLRKAWKPVMLAAALLACFGGTLAYYSFWQYMQNTLTVGENRIVIVEDYRPPKQLDVGENDYEKQIRIKNTGTVSCYVRVFMEFSDSRIRDLSWLSPDGLCYGPAVEYEKYLPEHWQYISEAEDSQLGGYYYYTEKLEAGSSTEPLIERVRTCFETIDQVRDYTLILYSESVQHLDRNGKEFSGEDGWRQAWKEFTVKVPDGSQAGVPDWKGGGPEREMA